MRNAGDEPAGDGRQQERFQAVQVRLLGALQQACRQRGLRLGSGQLRCWLRDDSGRDCHAGLADAAAVAAAGGSQHARLHAVGDALQHIVGRQLGGRERGERGARCSKRQTWLCWRGGAGRLQAGALPLAAAAALRAQPPVLQLALELA